MEDYDNPDDWRAGPRVTPEDLVDSQKSEIYHIWVNEKIYHIDPLPGIDPKKLA